LRSYGVLEREGSRSLSRRRCRGKATIKRSNGKRGLIAFDFIGPWEGSEVEGEKKTDAHHV
jgi:hypothetical protein